MSSSNSRLKTASGSRYAAILNVADRVATVHGTRKPKAPINPIDSLRNLAKHCQDTSIKISDLDAEREILFDKIQTLQEHLIRDQDIVAGLKLKISQLTMSNAPHTTTLTHSNSFEDLNVAGLSTISSSNCIHFLQNRPLILTYFLGFDDDFVRFACQLGQDVQPLFIGYSANQLRRFADCYNAYLKLSEMIENFDFFSHCIDAIGEIFETKSVINIVKDSKSNVFDCTIDGKEMHYEINADNSSIATALENDEVIVQNQNNMTDSFELDMIFNPSYKPSIVIPIGKDAALYIVSEKLGKYNLYNPEDQIVAIFMSYLLKPLYEEHMHFLNLMKEVDLQRSIFNFQQSIRSKNNFETLLPFLFDEITEYTNANDANLFIINDESDEENNSNKMSFYTFELVNNKLTTKPYNFTGIPKYIVETKKYFIADILNPNDHKEYDKSIDFWGMNKSFVGFPISIGNTVLAVLCIIDKNMSNSFTSWDVEFLSSISKSLSIILAQCIKSSGGKATNPQIALLNSLSYAISGIGKTFINEPNSITNIIQRFISFRILQFEWLAVYSNEIKNETQRNRIKRICVFHKNEMSEGFFIDDDIISTIFAGESFVFSTDQATIKSIIKVDIQSLQSVIIAHTESIALMGLGCAPGLNDEIQKFIFLSLLSLIDEAYGINQMKNKLQNSQNEGASVKNVLDVTATSIQNEKPLQSLLSMFCELISMTTFGMFQFNEDSETYEMILFGKDVKPGNFSNDILLKYATIIQQPRFIEDISATEYKSSHIINHFPSFTNLLIVPFNFSTLNSESLSDISSNITNEDHDLQSNSIKEELSEIGKTFVIFVGESITSNYDSLLNYFYPILICQFANNELKKKLANKTLHIHNRNRAVDQYLGTKISENELSSRIFAVTRIPEKELVKYILNIFQTLDLLQAMKADSKSIITTILSIRDAYNDIPFHNWLHAVDTTQFVYSCLVRGRMRRYFAPLQIAALILGALCHDVGHTGVNTTFHVKSKSSLFFAFGDQSTLERYHATVATKILEKSPIYEGIDNPVFWKFFVGVIIATDMVRHFEFIDSFKLIVDRFEYTNELHRLTLAQFLVKCGNFANTTRTFDVAQHFANGLLEEFRLQSEQEKEINVELTKFGDSNEMPLWDIEISFYTGIVSPTLKLLSRMTPDLNDFHIQLEDNQKQWDEFGKKNSA